jgi:hypothetical protein
LLNVETLNEWKDRSYGKPYFKKSLEFLLEVVKMFKNEDSVQQPESITNPRVESSENHRNNITRNDG